MNLFTKPELEGTLTILKYLQKYLLLAVATLFRNTM
jgi:hypothetical protein